jgi:DNA-binding response OmpR family regulator
MSQLGTSRHRRLALVESADRGGIVLERALAARGWTVIRSESACTIESEGVASFDAVLLALDGDDADVFELLLWLSSLPQRPSVVLMTRRANARVLGCEVLAALGIDRVAAWPARVEEIEAALVAAQHEHEPERLVS